MCPGILNDVRSFDYTHIYIIAIYISYDHNTTPTIFLVRHGLNSVKNMRKGRGNWPDILRRRRDVRQIPDLLVEIRHAAWGSLRFEKKIIYISIVYHSFSYQSEAQHVEKFDK